MNAEAMIRVRELRKTYGSFEAVRGISFEVGRGQVVGFLGPNGAGKSTTLRILAGFLGATSGEVFVDGVSLADDPLGARARIGYLPESTPLYPEMRIEEYLRFRAELKGVARGRRAEAVERAIGDAGLGGMGRVLIGQLSKGYRQRVGIADALVASPPLLLLDEPTAGLDPNQIREVRALVARLSERHTILVSTHILGEVEAMCDRAVVIARGELVASGTIAELRARSAPSSVRLRVRGTEAEVRSALSTVASLTPERCVVEPDASSNHVRVTIELRSHLRHDATREGEAADASANDVTTDDRAAAELTEQAVAAIVGAGLGVLEVVPESSFEQVFAELTTRAPGGARRKKRGLS